MGIINQPIVIMAYLGIGSLATLVTPIQVTSNPRAWWQWVILAIIFIALILLLLPVIKRWQRRRRCRTYRLELKNTGNVPDVYLLRAEDTAEGLQFDFTLRGQPLAELMLAGEPVATDTYSGTVPTTQPKPKPRKPKLSSKLSFVGKLGGISAFFGTLITTVGNALPYSIGLPLLRFGGKLTQGQRMAAQVQHGPRQLNSLQQATKQVTGTKPSNAPAKATPIGPSGPTSTASTAALALGPPVLWLRTPSLPQGKQIHLEMQISPLRPQVGGTYYFTVFSRREDADAGAARTEGQCYLMPLTGIERYGPFLVLVGLLATLSWAFLSLF